MADEEKRYTLIHEPETVVKGYKTVIRNDREYVHAEYETPTEGRFGKLLIPKDQLKELGGLKDKVKNKLKASAPPAPHIPEVDLHTNESSSQMNEWSDLRKQVKKDIGDL